MAADGDRFDDIFVDLDFSRVTEYATGDLGFGDAVFADYEDSLGVIPESEWPEHIEELERRNTGTEHLIVHIYNQGRVGSCTSHATCQAMMIAAAIQFGRQRTPILSPISLYKRVARGPNSGSTIEDNVDEAMGRGVLPADVSEQSARFKHVMPSGDWHARFPPGMGGNGAAIPARRGICVPLCCCRRQCAPAWPPCNSRARRPRNLLCATDVPTGRAICDLRQLVGPMGRWRRAVGIWFRARLRAATRACKHVGCRRPHREFRA
ncbi:MAG: hypothetical protein KatS3mg038_0418 [Candidatus Kapaibacterium sp.]|nr:MAG: hypothetical protein KatS3mg038_0418 [Candidatus Kapabacteria bacterium]